MNNVDAANNLRALADTIEAHPDWVTAMHQDAILVTGEKDGWQTTVVNGVTLRLTSAVVGTKELANV